MKSLFDKLKRRTGVFIFVLFGLCVILNPTLFITIGGDAGYKIFTSIWTLIMAYLAISQMDRHWSHYDKDKKVSLSRFMQESNNNQKVVIYAVLIFTVGHILSAVISS